MSTIFSRDFTGTNGDSWTTAGFRKAEGGASAPLIQSNAGWGPSSGGSELLYLAQAYPQSAGHKASVDLVWNDAAGTGRYLGILLRCTDDGQDCYSLELDSNVGTTRCRIRRRNAGTWTTVAAYASPAGIPASAQLNSGVTIVGRVENTDEDEVMVSLWYGSTELASYVDTSGSRLESGGSVGILLGSTWTDDDVIVDNLLVRDFADEWAGTGDLGEGIALVVDGTSYSWDELDAAGITVGRPRQSYTDDVVCTLADGGMFGEDSTILYPGAIVTVALDGYTVAFGVLRDASEALSTEEGRQYQVVGPLGLASDVNIRDPDYQGGTVRFNMPTTSAEYDSTRANLELGEIIAWIIDNHLEGDGGLRDQLAAPPSGPAYTQAELDAMDAVVPEISIQGDVRSAIESLLSYTDYASWVNPGTRLWEFHQRNTGTIRQVDVAADHVEGSSSIDPGRNFTAVLIRGTQPETTPTTFTNALGLSVGWDTGLEASHSYRDQYKVSDSGTVDLAGGGGGAALELTPAAPFAMDAHEWLGCVLEFEDGAEAGNTYNVDDNTGSVFTFEATAWQSGGPSVGDSFTVRGNKKGGGRDNGHRLVGRRYELTDPSLAIAEDPCAMAYVNGLPVSFTYENGDGTDPASIELDLPTVGLFTTNPASIADPCTDGESNYLSEADLEVELPVYDITSPIVPEKRFPASRFYGTAFTKDSAKWSGGGKPGRGDPRVMREYPLDLPAYTGGTDQDTEMAKLAEAILNVLSPLARSATIKIHGRLDTDWIGLDSRLQVIETGGNTGPWSTLTDLGVLAVEWDPLENATTIYAGTQANGPFDIQAMRRRFIGRSASTLLKEVTSLLRKFEDCAAGAPKAAGVTQQGAPVQLCGEQVSVPGPQGGGTNLLNSRIENADCTTSTSPKKKCNAFPCVTSFLPSKVYANVDAMDGKTIVDQRTVDFDPELDADGGALPGGMSILSAVVWCMEQIRALGYAFVAVTGAHDQELGATAADLASVRTNLDAIVACMNANWVAIDACFKRRVVTTEHATGCTLDVCTHDFTETVCENPCDVDKAVIDVSTPSVC